MKKTKKKFESIHAQCLKVKILDDGRTLVCAKSKGHGDVDPKRREHYDPSEEERWTD